MSEGALEPSNMIPAILTLKSYFSERPRLVAISLFIICVIILIMIWISGISSLPAGFWASNGTTLKQSIVLPKTTEEVFQNVLLANNGEGVEGGVFLCPEVVEKLENFARSSFHACEIGFGAGFSSALMLYSGAAKVTTFDLFDREGKVRVAEMLSNLYPDKFENVTGDFRTTIEEYYLANPKTFCDLILLDALHPEDFEMGRQLAIPEQSIALYHGGGGGQTNTYSYVHSGDRNFMEDVCIDVQCRSTPNVDGYDTNRKYCFGRYGD